MSVTGLEAKPHSILRRVPPAQAQAKKPARSTSSTLQGTLVETSTAAKSGSYERLRMGSEVSRPLPRAGALCAHCLPPKASAVPRTATFGMSHRTRNPTASLLMWNPIHRESRPMSVTGSGARHSPRCQRCRSHPSGVPTASTRSGAGRRTGGQVGRPKPPPPPPPLPPPPSARGGRAGGLAGRQVSRAASAAATPC